MYITVLDKPHEENRPTPSIQLEQDLMIATFRLTCGFCLGSGHTPLQSRN